MIMVIGRAKTYLRESVLAKIQAKTPGVGVRLAQTEAGKLGVFPDKKMEGDQVVEQQGAVMLIDGALSARLTGATIDCVESVGESHLGDARPAHRLLRSQHRHGGGASRSGRAASSGRRDRLAWRTA
jgi:Fe-S cluster assembly iron-binding protein IscA